MADLTQTGQPPGIVLEPRTIFRSGEVSLHGSMLFDLSQYIQSVLFLVCYSS